MIQMFHIEADQVTRITCGDAYTATGLEDPRIPSFVRNCLRSYSERIAPTLPQCDNKEVVTIRPIVVTREETPVVLAVPKHILCALEGSVYTGIYYAFLMTHPLHGKKTSANVGYSTNPMHDVYLHNNLLANDRTTSAAAPHWVLDMVIGSFISVEKAIECSNDWVSNSRGIESKRKRAPLLARINGVKLYSMQKKPTVPLKKYLSKTAPAIYMDAYENAVSRKKKSIE